MIEESISDLEIHARVVEEFAPPHLAHVVPLPLTCGLCLVRRVSVGFVGSIFQSRCRRGYTTRRRSSLAVAGSRPRDPSAARMIVAPSKRHSLRS